MLVNKEYKDSGISWIGDLPMSWQISKLKYLYDSSNAGEVIDRTYWDVGEELLYTCQRTQIFSNYPFFPAAKRTKYGDLLLTRNATPYIFIPKNGSIYSNVVQRIHISPNVDFNYVKYSLQCGVNAEMVNGDTIPSWNMQVWDNIFIPMPNLSKQKSIADYLDKECARIDSIVEKQRQIIERLKEYKKSVITEAVTRGLNPDTPMKDSGIEWIGKIPAHWEATRTKYTANSLEKGNGITKDDVVLDGDIQCIRYGEIYSKYNTQVMECVSATNINQINTPKQIYKGDILFAGTGELIEEIGKNVVYMGNKPCLAGGDIVILKPNQNPVFLNYALGSTYAQAQKSFGKIKLKVVHISADAIGNIRVALPPSSEQQEIADYLDRKCSEIDSIIEKRERMIELMTEYKKSLIYECVTGKKEIVDVVE